MNIRISTLVLIVVASLLSGIAPAQDPAASPPVTFNQAANSAQTRLEQSIAELARLREQAAEETIPLSRELRQLEAELSDVRQELQSTTRLLDSRTLDLTNLRNEIESREESAAYLTTLLNEYIRNFESRLHISELRRYEEELDKAKLALEDTTLSSEETFDIQAEVLQASLRRIDDIMGGTLFEGQAVNPEGLVSNGQFLLLGPSALFKSADGEYIGTAEQRLGSLEPAVIPFKDESDFEAARALFEARTGSYPFDPTLGNAHKIERTEETFAEHVAKGGPVMVPIFALAGISLLVALVKWLTLVIIRTPSRKRQQRILDAVARQDAIGAYELAKKCGRIDYLWDSVPGAIFGLIAAFLVYLLLGIPYLAGVLSPIAFLREDFSLPVLMILAAVACAALLFIMRFVAGYSPVGTMLRVGAKHLEYPPALIEETMYERILSSRLRLESFLPLIAISAAAAPLLGLLGTVTGIINTFKLITVFGSGDVKTLSGGISEALITTEFGLIAAIPALLIHAFLQRKARRVTNQMEKAGVALVNQVNKTPLPDDAQLPLSGVIDKRAFLKLGERSDDAIPTPDANSESNKEAKADEKKPESPPDSSKLASEGGGA